MAKRKTAAEIEMEQQEAAKNVRRKVPTDNPLNSTTSQESQVEEIQLSTKDKRIALMAAENGKSSIYLPDSIFSILKIKAMKENKRGYNEILKDLIINDLLSDEEIKEAYIMETKK